MADADDKRRRVIMKWVMYAVLLAVFILMVTVVDKARKDTWQRISFTFGAFVTLALYSFLFGENELYRFVEHMIVGMVAATGFALALENNLYPLWYVPMRDGVKSVFWQGKFDAKVFWVLAPLPGAFWYMIYTKRWLWLSRLVAVFVIGAGIGQALKLNFANLVSQAAGTFKPLWPPEKLGLTGWLEIAFFVFTNVLFITIVLVVLFYFVFTLRIGDHPFGRKTQTVGRVFMMMAFGVVFGTVVGTRMGLVTDRIYFLVEEWAKPIIHSWF